MYKIPFLGGALAAGIHQSAEQLVESWRDGFRRRPFEVSEAGIWVRFQGVTPEFQERLRRWRQKLFNTLACAIVLLVVAVACLFPAAFFLVAESWRKAGIWALAFLGSVLLSRVVMTWGLSRVFRARPKLT